MYVSRSVIGLQGRSDNELLTEVAAAHESRRAADGFRWAMLLRPIDEAEDYTSVSMWLTPEHNAAWRKANDVPPTLHGYDVATARGAMTPAAAAAIVHWEVSPAVANRFAARWNAFFHDIEDVLGSRLLQDLAAPTAYAGLHAVIDPTGLDPAILSAPITDAEGLAVIPIAVERFEVVLLTEA